MKFIALIDIGDYKVGDEVPEEKALTWKEMYAVSPVKEEVIEPIIEKKTYTRKSKKKR